jgi:putative oxidoreductase
MVRRTVIVICYILFIAMFAYSGWAKFADPGAFSTTLKNYKILSIDWIPFFTFYIPAVEVILAVAFFIPYTRRASLFSCFFLILGFQVALSSLLIRGIDADCGCLGNLGSSPLVALVRNFILLAALVFLYRSSKLQLSTGIDDSALYE